MQRASARSRIHSWHVAGGTMFAAKTKAASRQTCLQELHCRGPGDNRASNDMSARCLLCRDLRPPLSV